MCGNDAAHCPCLPDSVNPECPADEVCCDEGLHSGIQTTSFAKVAEPVARFPVRPKRAVSKAVITQLNSRLHTAQMVAGQEVHQDKDASDSCDTCSTTGDSTVCGSQL